MGVWMVDIVVQMNRTEKQIVYVCKNVRRALLGKPTISKFDMIQMNIPHNYSCGEINMMDESREENEAVDW